MAENDDLISSYGGDGSEPWALEETQEDILQQIKQYIARNANADTKNLRSIAKNVAEMMDKSDEVDLLEKMFEEAQQQGDQMSLQYKAEKQAWLKQQANNKVQQELFESDRESRERDNEAFDLLEGKARRAGRAVGEFSDSLINFDGDWSRFIASIPIAGVALGALAKFGGSIVGSFREMNMVGQSFGGNLITMTQYAKQAGISFQDLSKFVQKNSRVAASVGLRVLTETAGAVRDVTKASQNFGFSVDTINDFTASYLEQAKIRDFFDSMTAQERTQRTVEYIKNLRQLSEMTGKSAEDLDRQRRSMDSQVELQIAMGMMSAQERDLFNQGLEGLRNEMGRLPDSMQQDLQATMANFKRTGTLATTELGRTIMRFPELRSALEEASRLTLAGDAKGAQRAMARFNDGLEVLNQRSEISAQAFGQGAESLKQMILAGADLKNQMTAEELERKKQKDLEKKILDQAMAMQKKNANLSNKEAIQLARKKVEGEIKASENLIKVQEELRSSFAVLQNAVAEALIDTNILPFLAQAATELLGSFSDLIGAFKDGDKYDVMGVIGDLLGKIGSAIWDVFGDSLFWGGLLAGVGILIGKSVIGGVTGMLGNALGGLFGGRDKNDSPGGGRSGGGGLGLIGGAFAGLGEGIGAIIESLVKALTMAGVAGLAIIKGAGALAIAIPLLGGSVAGTVWLMNKMGFAESMQGISQGLSYLADVDGFGLAGTGLALIPLAAGFGAFAVGGGLAAIMDYFGGDSLINIANTLQKFADVSGDALSNTAQAMIQLAYSIDSFAGSAFFKDVDDMEDGVEVLQDLADLGPGLERTAQSLRAMAESMNMFNMDTSPLENSIFDRDGDRAGKILARQVLRNRQTMPDGNINVNSAAQSQDLLSAVNQAVQTMREMKNVMETAERRMEVGNMLLADIRSYSDKESRTAADILRATRRSSGVLN